MENYEPAMSFGEDVAELYDDVAQRGDEMATVAFLEQLARGGPALELAIGTGRIALPLAARGIRVDGIDFSPAMVAKLRAMKTDDNVLLLKTNMGAGHGGKSGRFERLHENAEEAAFLVWQLGLVE